MGNVNNLEKNENDIDAMFDTVFTNNNNNNNELVGRPEIILEEYEYKCPVDGCENRIKETITKGGFYMCGIPQHCCHSCTDKGWKHLSGHGGQPKTWREEEEEEPKTTHRERVIVINTPKKYVYDPHTEEINRRRRQEEEQEQQRATLRPEEWEEYEYKCPVDGCENRIKDMITKGGFYMCGIPQHCCHSCTDKGWKHLSGHGGQPETWREAPIDNV